ncbi:hypothetical protein CAP36_13530 [Chitinophagaceae bacterium IBVUCB2]|nr:hypothetical protein CAP36_13530 [Chitinophagaceae bacterium IBVUCB2]
MNPVLKKQPLYLLLLPIFFVLHGYITFYGRVPIGSASILCIKYIGVSVLIALLFYLFYRDLQKASILAFLVMCYNLFFGPAHDFIRTILGNSFFAKHTFILPFSAILLLAIILLLKRTKKDLSTLTLYLNILFLILIIIDTGNLLLNKLTKKIVSVVTFPKELTTCDTCAKPDIYLIVADEYANNKQLKEYLGFDNSQYEKNLSNRGFHVVQNSKSNYNSTPFSIASLLNMNFIDSLGDRFNDKSLNASFNQINHNAVTAWLKQQGYTIKNNSAFPIDNIPNPVSSTFFNTGTLLFTMHTFIGRFNSDIRWNFITRFKIKSEIKKFVRGRLDINQTLIDNTISEAKRKNPKPRFVYLHLMLPHFPYLLDSSGHPDYETSFLETNRQDKKRYLGYLQYGNTLFLKLIDEIQTASPKAIILFMGDHGFRFLEGNQEMHFMSFNSIYLPGKNYEKFYDSMSMVNQFRVLLNTSFNQRLPLLKDSTIFIKNWW